MSKVHYLNSHLDKYREKSKITIVAENINIIADSDIPLDEWAKHPISEKQGE